MADLKRDDSDDEPPELVEEEEIYPAGRYGDQSLIALQVKRSHFGINVAPHHQWAFLKLDLVPAQSEWESTLKLLLHSGHCLYTFDTVSTFGWTPFRFPFCSFVGIFCHPSLLI